MKKLYSFRADVSLLEALREESDARDITVTDLMHEFLYDGLKRSGKEIQPSIIDSKINIEDNLNSQIEKLNRNLEQQLAFSYSKSLDETMEKRFQKLRDELKDEISEIKADIRDLNESSRLHQINRKE